MSNRELEWFDLETKMWEVLYYQLSPVINKAREDREELFAVKSYCSKLETRLNKLETVVLGDKDQETVLIDIHNRCAQIEGRRKSDVVRIDQEIVFINEKIKSIDFGIVDINENLQKLLNKINDLEDENLNIKVNIDQNKDSYMEELNKMGENFKELNQYYLDISVKADEKASSAINKIKSFTVEIGGHKKDMDNIWKSYYESLNATKEMSMSKLSIDEFTKEIDRIEGKLKAIHENLIFHKEEFLSRDLFIDKYFPLKIACMVSDYLHYSLDIKTKAKVAHFEQLLFEELNKETLSTTNESRESQVKKILEELRHVEDRKSEFTKQMPLKGRQMTIKNTSESKEENTSQITLNTQKQLILKALVTEKVDENAEEKLFIKLDSEIIKIKIDMQAKVESINQNIKNISDQHNVVIKQLLSELTDLRNDKLKEKNDYSKEINRIKASIQVNKILTDSHEEQIPKLIRMIVCLVENAQIQQALEAQDEEDRHAIAQNFDKDLQNELIKSASPDHYSTSVPSAVFSVKKNCLSCGSTTSMLSGIRTSVVYRPTPLFYREKLYQRPELISIKGKLIKTSWDTSNLPWKLEEVEPLFTQASKNSRIISMNEPTKLEIDKELPYLNMSTSRNRKKSRIQIRQINNSCERN